MTAGRCLLLVALVVAGARAEAGNLPPEVTAVLQPWQASCSVGGGARQALAVCLDTAGDVQERRKCLLEATASIHGAQNRANNDAALVAYRQDGEGLRREIIDHAERLREVVTALPVPALAGVVDDFSNSALPSLMQVTGDLAEPQTLGLSVNLPRFLRLKARLGGYANPAPELNTLLESVLLERGQLAALRTRENRLDVGDDYSLNADITVLGAWLGRDPSDHAAAQSRLARSVMAGADLAGGDLRSQDFQRAAMILVNQPSFDAEHRDAVLCAVRQYTEFSRSERAPLAQALLGDYWRLVHNQPQLTLTYRRLYRDAIVGADSETVRLKLTSGLFNNVNFLRWTRPCTSALGGDDCPEAYRAMQERWPMRHGLGAALYFEAGRLADVRLQLPDENGQPTDVLLPPLVSEQLVADDAVFRLEGGDYHRYGWSVGAVLLQMQNGDGRGKASMRLDGGVDYYRYQRDPVRLDHSVSRLTLTYRRGNFSFPFHLMHRSRSAFTTDLDDELVLGVGVQSDFSQW